MTRDTDNDDEGLVEAMGRLDSAIRAKREVTRVPSFPLWASFAYACARWECGELATHWRWGIGGCREFWCSTCAPPDVHPLPKLQAEEVGK